MTQGPTKGIPREYLGNSEGISRQYPMAHDSKFSQISNFGGKMSNQDRKYLHYYSVGTVYVQEIRKLGWAIGKGEIKKIIRAEVYFPIWDVNPGFMDAILDSVN